MPENLTDLIAELALANRILAHEGVLDAFGHVSVRDPRNPHRYLISRSIAPESVTAAQSTHPRSRGNTPYICWRGCFPVSLCLGQNAIMRVPPPVAGILAI